MSHRHLNRLPDGRPDDDFNFDSLRGAGNRVGFLGIPPPIRVTKDGLIKLAIAAAIVAIAGFIFGA